MINKTDLETETLAAQLEAIYMVAWLEFNWEQDYLEYFTHKLTSA